MRPWAEKKVSDLIDGLVAGVSVRSRDGDLSRPAVLKTSAVAGGRVDFRETKAIIAADVSRAKCAPVRDSIVVSRMNTPALVGAVGYVEADESGVFLPDRLWLARSRRTASTDMRWLNYALGFGDVASRVRELATGTSNSMKNIPKSRLLELSVLVPIPEEQRAISTVLADIDGAIACLERLVAKKRGIKQGMMQDLLTGRTRLPGFDGEIRFKKLGSIASMGSGGTPPRSNSSYYGGGIPWVSISDMTSCGKRISRTSSTLSNEGLAASAARLYSPNVVLYAMYASLGECSLAVGRVASSQAILGIQPGPELDGEYLYYWLSSIKELVKTMGQQGTQSNLNAGMVREFDVRLPQLDEQRAIATTLSDADAEIEALERRLETTRDIMQGMMQELLTGRSRLPVDEEMTV